MKGVFEEFDPPGLGNYVELAKAGFNDQAREIIIRIEQLLQDTVLTVLKDEFSEDAQAWWFSGVPLGIRKKVTQKIEESDGKAGSREQNFDLIHYRDIILKQWSLFESMFALGKSGNKEKRTGWMKDVNSMRNKVMHPSRREFLSAGDVERLKELENEIRSNIDSKP